MVDFDNTIYNSKRYLSALIALMVPNRVLSLKRFERIMERHKGSEGRMPFIPAQFFEKHYPWFYRQQLLDDFICNKSGSYLYSDAITFLKKVRKLDAQVELITFADKETRIAQIEATGIRPYFDRVSIFSRNFKEKIDYVSEVNRSSRCVIIDDHPSVLAPLERTGVYCIRLQRRVYKRYLLTEPVLHTAAVVQTLKGAYRHLERYVVEGR